MEISTDEMNTSIGIAETYLGKFKVGNRCHWGLRPNADKVLRLIASIILTKKLHLKILERPITRREYSEFRDHALTILGNTRALSPPELSHHKSEFFTLSVCSSSIGELIREVFEIEKFNRWTCKIPKSELFKGYFDAPMIKESDVFELVDFKDLLRFIIQIQNNATFIFPKDLKEVGRHVLSDAKSVITPAEDIIKSLPDYYRPKILVSDGTNIDIQVLNTRTGESTWTSLLKMSSIVCTDFVRAFRIHKNRDREGHTFKGLFDYSEIYKTLPKKSEYRKLQVKEELVKIKQTLTPEQVDQQLREELARVMG